MKFKIGQIVGHDTMGLGAVLSCINIADQEDIALQGYRYSVEFWGGIWSVPESSLFEPYKATTYITTGT